MDKALEHKAYFQAQPLSQAEQDYFSQQARQSITDHNQFERKQEEDFDTYLEQIHEQYLALAN